MPSIGGIAKYIGLFSIGKGFIDKAVFQRLLSGIAAVVGLAVVAGLLTGIVIVSLLYILYYSLAQTDMGETTAILIVGAIILALLGLIIYKIVGAVKKIATFSTLLAQSSAPASPIGDAVSSIVHAFLDGLKEPQAQDTAKPNLKSAK